MSIQWRRNFQAGKNVLIIGGGYIGLEAAAVAASKGPKCHFGGNGRSHLEPRRL